MPKKKKVVSDEPFEEKIIEAEYSEVMKKSYINYAMSVIVERALPDIRDGLKPVQRRIIYDMDELGANSNSPYRKSARIDGDTMGKYHPHGNAAIYEAMVVMAQDFKKGQTLIDGHGNFGSIEGDPFAADRYTEARLDKFSEDVLLKDLKNDTVKFNPNYDENETEPEILPCKAPLFLINGSEGIAVGMVTNTPPHNIREVIDTALYYLDHQKATNEELLNILHGPDFPTGGIISNKNDLLSIYETGVGKIKVRGKVVFEPGKGSEKDKLVITEIPYTMIGGGISKFLQSVADLVEDRTLPEIVDITNQTSNEGVRIVLELKKGTDYKYVENMLYKKTRLEDTFGVNMLAVVNKRPEVLSLTDIMREFTAFQFETYSKKFTSLLQKAEKKKEVDEGLIIATDCIDTIIEMLRGSKAIKQSKDCLMTGNTDGINFKTKTCEKQAKKFHFTEVQADAILDMKMSRLVGLELDTLQKDLDMQNKAIAKYTKILSKDTELKKEIKTELINIRDKFGRDRRTEIIDAKPIEIVEKEEEEEEIVILSDRFNYFHAVDKNVYDKNKDTISGDFIYKIETTNKDKLVVFCDSGKAHIIKTSEIPYGKLRDKGQPLDNISNYNSKSENVIGIATINSGIPLIFISSDGFVKKVNVNEFDVTRKTVDATKLKDNAKLISVTPYNEKGYMVLGTANDIFIRFKQEEIPEQKKNAVGAIGIKMENDELQYVFNVEKVKDELNIKDGITISADRIKLTRRGGKGNKVKF